MNQNETMGRSSGPALSPAAVAQREGFQHVYHLLHVGNLPSITNKGLMSRTALDEAGVEAASLQSPAVREERAHNLVLPDGTERSLDSFLPLRWDPRTPVLANLAYDWVSGRYRLDRQAYLVILACHVDALDTAAGLWFATGHPFALCTRILEASQWSDMPWEELRRGRQPAPNRPAAAAEGELLFDGRIDPSYFVYGAVCCEESLVRAQALAPDLPISVVPEFFFGERETVLHTRAGSS
ncbi:MAG: hypothetical protein BWY79_01599 [Actinobacteria bacterium ADurb.Bin444]|nr:MAG: hypothetical protein BWY79_01599 [Actinobacteria bacterium ADurb.Bin444]